MLVVGFSEGSLHQRIVAELEALGYEAASVSVAPEAERGPDELEVLARAHRASAAIWVDAAQDHIAIWVVDRMTGKTLLRRIPLEEEERIVAVRAVELLWSGLLELERSPQPPSADMPPPPATQRLLRPADPRHGVALGIAVAGSPGGLSAAAFVRGGFRWMPHRRIGLLVQVTGPLTALRGAAAEGQFDARAGWAGLGPRVAWGRPRGRVQGAVAVTGGPALFAVRGTAVPPFQGLRDLVVVAMIEAVASMDVALSSHVRLGVEGSAGVGLPVPAVIVASHRAAHWGRPLFLGTLALAYVW